jgi:hypothetical protein
MLTRVGAGTSRGEMPLDPLGAVVLLSAVGLLAAVVVALAAFVEKT